jgi:ferredoxin-NADP reductase
VPSYRTSLLSREYVAEGTLAVRVAKPAGFSFHAGQYADLVLLDPPRNDLWGDLRTFSIASAPYEADLDFLMRVSTTAYKQVLSAAPVGSAMELNGPGGKIRLHPDADRPAVFLAGGVGIAPFLSMLRQAEHDRATHAFYLFYANRRPGDTAYLDEMRKLAAAGPLNFHFVPIITGNSAADWNGERGRPDASMLRRYLPREIHPVYYVAGPSQFVSGMISALTVMDVGEADLRIEDFGEF